MCQLVKGPLAFEGEATIRSPNAQQRTPSDLMQYPRQGEFQQFFAQNKRRTKFSVIHMPQDTQGNIYKRISNIKYTRENDIYMYPIALQINRLIAKVRSHLYIRHL